MKFSLILLFSILITNSFSQQRFLFLDKETKEPIPNVNIQDINKETVAISNSAGEVFLHQLKDSIYFATSLGYKPKSVHFNSYSEILLEPTSREINEVAEKGEKNLNFYDLLLSNSAKSIKNENSIGKLNYFISNYFIIEDTVLNTSDTMIVNSEADFFFNLIANKKNTKRTFEFIPIDAKRNLHPFKNEKLKQQHSNNPVFLKPGFNYFKSLFGYELSSTERLELQKNNDYKSIRYSDSISHLRFLAKNSKDEIVTSAFYSATDTTLLQYSRQGNNESGRFYISSSYTIKDGIYFLSDAKEELSVKINLENRILKTITIQMITIQNIERITSNESFHNGTKVDPMDFILNTPLSETDFPILLFPSK